MKTTTTKKKKQFLPKQNPHLQNELEIKLALLEQQITILTKEIESLELKVNNLCQLTNYGIGAWKSLLILGTFTGIIISFYNAIKEFVK